ncbi:MAG: sulfurtransferase [Spirochaetaceae bacterium]|nr:MAG: sulfurtransferase [Spirochaetaceae bacterium]
MGKASIAAHASLLIDAAEVHSQLHSGTLLLIDTREREAYSKGHLPGAVNLPPSSMEWSARLSAGVEVHHLLAPVEGIIPLLSFLGVNRDSRIVLYDEGAGYTAARIYWILDYFNHPHLSILNGGLAAWGSLSIPLSSEDASRQRGDFVPDPTPDKIADFQTVRSSQQDGATVLLNTLPRASFQREAIPGSVNIPYMATYQSRKPHRLLESDQLEELFRKAAISQHQEVIPYCGIGYTASQLYFVARLLGYPRVRLYDGSLIDWKARGGVLAPGGAPASRW